MLWTIDDKEESVNASEQLEKTLIAEGVAAGKRVKMSKSRGNVVGVDEVVYGVARLDDSYEFRDAQGVVVLWQKIHIWQDKAGDGCFRMGSRFGKRPVWLCEKGKAEPCVLLIDGEEVVQHENLLTRRKA